MGYKRHDAFVHPLCRDDKTFSDNNVDTKYCECVKPEIAFGHPEYCFGCGNPTTPPPDLKQEIIRLKAELKQLKAFIDKQIKSNINCKACKKAWLDEFKALSGSGDING